jgi:hypothetical protein
MLQAEFGTPQTLLENKRGLLYRLVEESTDKNILLDMASKGR